MSFPLFCVLCWLGLAHLVEIARNQVNQNQNRCPRNGRRPRTSVLSSRNSILSLVRFLKHVPLFPRIPVLLIGLLTASSSSSRLSSYPYQYSGCRDSNQLLFFSARYHLGGVLRKRFRPIEIEGQYLSTFEESGINQGRRGRFGGESLFLLIPLSTYCLALKQFFSTAPANPHTCPLTFYSNILPRALSSILFCYACIHFLNTVCLHRLYASPPAQQESNRIRFILKFSNFFGVKLC